MMVYLVGSEVERSGRGLVEVLQAVCFEEREITPASIVNVPSET
jgi:hypothetical protein